MRLPILAALVLLCFSTAFSQSKPVVQDKGNFGLHVVNDYINQHPDGKYFALDAGRSLQIYETENGKLKVELANVELPSWGWFDNEVLASVDYKQKNLFELGKVVKAYDANDGRFLFKQKLEFDQIERPSFLDNGDETEVINDTYLRPHPFRKVFLAVSDLSVKIFDSRSGELLQTVVEPLIKIDSKGKIRRTHGYTVESADWSKDGNTLYVF